MQGKKFLIIFSSSVILGIILCVIIFINLKVIAIFISKAKHKLEERMIINILPAKEPLVICDFENAEDLNKWNYSNAKMELSGEHITSGKYATKVQIQSASGAAGVKLERCFDKNKGLTDWSRYEVLVFDIFNPGVDKERIILQIKDRQEARAKINLFLEPKTNNRIKIDIAQLRESIRPDNISQFNLFLWDNQADKVFYLDNIRLLPAAVFEKDNKSILDAEFLPRQGEKIYQTGDYFAFDNSGWLRSDSEKRISYIEFPLIVKNYLHVALRDASLSGGVPFPRGQLKSLNNLSLVDDQGNQIAFQPKAMSYWPDRSIKWLLVSLKSDVPLDEEKRLYMRYGDSFKKQELNFSLDINSDSEVVTVNTGVLKFTINKKNFYLFDKVWFDKNKDKKFDENEVVISKADLVLAHNGKEYYSHLDKDCQLSIEENGPIRVCLKVKGWFVSEKGEKFCQFIVRIYAFAGSSSLNAQHTFVFTGYPENKFHYLYEGKRLPKNETIGAVYIKVPTKIIEEGGKYTFEADNQVIQGNFQKTVKFLQDKFNHYSITKTETNETLGSGKKLAGWIDFSTAERGVSFGVKNFWQQFPKGIRIDKEGQYIILGLWPKEAGDLDLKTTNAAYGPDAVARGSAFGLAKTHEIFLYFHKGDYQSSAAKDTISALCSDILILAEPKWVSATRVLGKVLEFDRRLYPAEEFLIRLFYWADRQIKNFGWYGMIDFGDTLSWYRQEAYDKSYDEWGWHPEGRWGWFNCEAAGTHTGALIQFLRTGEYKYFNFGANLARHIMDIDTCHYNTVANDKRLKGVIPDDYSQPGSMHRHNGNHWGGRNEETSHTNITGLILYYYITGDERARDVIDEIGSFFLKERITYFRHPDIAPQRNIANVLWGDILLYELTADEKHKKAADKWADLLYKGQKHNGAWSENYNPVKKRWEGESEASFMRFYTIPALIEYHKLTGNKAIAECIIKGTDFNLTEEYSPFFGSAAYSYWLTGNKKYAEVIKNKVDFVVAHQKKSDDPLWDGMIYQKGYYSRVMEFLFELPYAFEVLADEK